MHLLRLGSRLHVASNCRVTVRTGTGTAAAAAACQHTGRTHACAGRVCKDINAGREGCPLTKGLAAALWRCGLHLGKGIGGPVEAVGAAVQAVLACICAGSDAILQHEHCGQVTCRINASQAQCTG